MLLHKTLCHDRNVLNVSLDFPVGRVVFFQYSWDHIALNLNWQIHFQYAITQYGSLSATKNL